METEQIHCCQKDGNLNINNERLTFLMFVIRPFINRVVIVKVEEQDVHDIQAKSMLTGMNRLDFSPGSHFCVGGSKNKPSSFVRVSGGNVNVLFV